jgi:poly-gamma-glutamate synthesis protein (capsule biosynthesis protein)
MMLAGDVNLLGVVDADVPFARVRETLGGADVVFANLECCFHAPPRPRGLHREGFYVAPAVARALADAGFHAVGMANNVNFGEDAIVSSVTALDQLGVAHTGAGANTRAAYAPAMIEHAGMRFGFLQRTSVFWSTEQEAEDNAPGVAVVRGHTAYRPPLETHRGGTRPGTPLEILTWTDPAHLERFRADVAALRTQADMVVASHHWGYDENVLDYQVEIAHAAIDAGADVVMGHGPHMPCAIEVYRGKPVFYGLGSFSFDIGHRGRKHGDWIGLMARIALDGSEIVEAAFQPVRHNDRNETILRSAAEERPAMERIAEISARFATTLELREDDVLVAGRGG